MHDSADGFLLPEANGNKVAVPVECKGRVMANIFHWTLARFNCKNGLPGMSGLEGDANCAKR